MASCAAFQEARLDMKICGTMEEDVSLQGQIEHEIEKREMRKRIEQDIPIYFDNGDRGTQADNVQIEMFKKREERMSLAIKKQQEPEYLELENNNVQQPQGAEAQMPNNQQPVQNPQMHQPQNPTPFFPYQMQQPHNPTPRNIYPQLPNRQPVLQQWGIRIPTELQRMPYICMPMVLPPKTPANTVVLTENDLIPVLHYPFVKYQKLPVGSYQNFLSLNGVPSVQFIDVYPAGRRTHNDDLPPPPSPVYSCTPSAPVYGFISPNRRQ